MYPVGIAVSAGVLLVVVLISVWCGCTGPRYEAYLDDDGGGDRIPKLQYFRMDGCPHCERFDSVWAELEASGDFADVLTAIAGPAVPAVAAAAGQPKGGWIPEVPAGLAGRAVNALIVAAVFVVVSMMPLESIVARLAPSGGGSFRIPLLGMAIGAGPIAMLLKSIAAGAAVQGLMHC